MHLCCAINWMIMNIGSTTIKSLKYETIRFMYTNRGGSVMGFMIALCTHMMIITIVTSDSV